MLWNKKLPEWKAKGTEPPEELKEEGFTAGYKPPAPYFNWLFNAIYESVQEIRNALKEIAVTGKAADLQEDEEHRLVTDTEKQTWNGKANADHDHNAATANAAGLMSAADKKKLDGITEKANNYSHPTSAGNKHIPAGGSSGQILRWSADGTAAWGNDNNTTYNAATANAAGLMSAADKTKLNGIATGANVTPSGLMSGYVRTGQKTGSTIGQYATAAGYNCTATKIAAVAYGYNNNATGECAFAMGAGGEASANYAVCFSGGGRASAEYAFAAGCETVAKHTDATTFGYKTHTTSSYQLVCGLPNDDSSGLLIVGNGTSTTPSNAFRVTSSGAVYGKGAFNTSGADYAEYFEWLDGNPGAQDRRGYFVTMEGDKIRIANSDDDYILGVVSGRPSVIGNSDPDDWHGHFLVDEFGNFITEKTIEKRKERRFVEIEETYLDEDGTEKIRLIPKMTEEEIEVEADSYVLNPEFDPNKPYVPRAKRKEWAAVGMLGVLLVRDDGTCKVNGYCKVADGGIATTSKSGWRVIARINEHLVKIVFR